ncbi:hypothetical protein Poli38472_000372 [Pythium oligandrum]|uniref:Protein CLP1 homolog n=1 Tax=Pythium oligandrum TaxID=41045 RepID=A0A8K1FEA6_PYTOL|nr:hypothetical protein Poli38472_000372 [Pythium oligandrum]|eukprot:TMW60330.1 hypothetical protein Poli38472_000372 [Pythium oligandrum]
MCDRYSFKKVYIISSEICLLGNIVYLIAVSNPGKRGMTMLAISRFLVGFDAGNRSVCRANVAAMTTSAQRLKYINLHAAVVFVGYALTPGLGSLVAHVDANIFGIQLNKFTSSGLILVGFNLATIVAMLTVFDETVGKQDGPPETPRALLASDALDDPTTLPSRIVRLGAVVFIFLNFNARGILSVFETVNIPLYLGVTGRDPGSTEAVVAASNFQFYLGVLGLGSYVGAEYFRARISDITWLHIGFGTLLMGNFVLVLAPHTLSFTHLTMAELLSIPHIRLVGITTMEQVVLERECEYRVEVSAQAPVTVKLVSGSAELFGIELAIDNEYTLRDQKAAIFTWYGATLQVTGTPEVAYTSDETPMNSYVNIHAQLQKRRELAKLKGIAGPRVLIAGPVDSGKSTLTSILLNYALRLGEKPTHVDLDVGQSSLSVPGSVAATPLDMNCLSIEDGYVLTNPLAFFYGHTNMAENAEHFRSMLQQLARAVKRRLADDNEVNASGCVINTCGWVDGLGYDLLVESIQAFEVDVVLVIGQDRLFSRLQSSLAKLPGADRFSIVKLVRSGGVVPLNSKFRSTRRQSRIRDYFYGSHALTRPIPLLSPCINEYSLDEVEFYAIKDMRVSAGMLPVGQTASEMSRLAVTKLEKTMELLHSIAAVAHPKRHDSRDALTSTSSDLSWLLTASSAGFVFVKEIREADKKIVLLVPSPGPLPSKYLLVGSIKWIE